MRILIVEDHAIVREGLTLALQTLASPDEGCTVLSAGDADGATQLLETEENFDLVLLDLMLPGVGGVAFLGAMGKRFPHVPVVVLSALDDAETVKRAMRQGAAGFVSKSCSTGVLLEALSAVLSGKTWFPPELLESGVNRKRPQTVAERYGLTKTQNAVLELLSEGKSNQEIADLLGVSLGTVKIHVSAILKALGVSRRSQALLLAKSKRQWS